MNLLYRLSIPSLPLEEAWNALEDVGIEILYGSEEEGFTEIYAIIPSLEVLASFDWIAELSPYTLPAIDWEAQWAAHGQNFQEGYLHVNFPSSSLRLKPGSGFGDLSHPTTRLMLRLLARHLKGQIVIDIGCGSGILTLAAIAMGAPLAYGIDIDQGAIDHSHQNALLNQLDSQCIFCDPSHFQWKESSQPVFILMNMIQSEQQTAWSSLPALHHQTAAYLTSGIRVEEREAYLALVNRWGWTLQEEEEEMGWLAFYFLGQGTGH